MPSSDDLRGFDRDFGEFLDVMGQGSAGDVQRAYIELAKKYHPDNNRGAPGAAGERLKEINRAHKNWKEGGAGKARLEAERDRAERAGTEAEAETKAKAGSDKFSRPKSAKAGAGARVVSAAILLVCAALWLWHGLSRPDVYAGGSDRGRAVVWKNGKVRWRLSDSPGVVNSIAVSDDGDVYAGGSDGDGDAVVWKNDDFGWSPGEDFIAVSPDGDVYTGAHDGGGGYEVRGAGGLLCRLDEGEANSIAVSTGGDVYAGGSDEDGSVVWKNGEVLWRPREGEASSVAVSPKGDVYAGGSDGRQAVVWKNGKVRWRFRGATVTCVFAR